MQRADGLGRALLDRVGDADEARRLSVDGHEHHRLALGAQRLGRSRRSPSVDAELGHQRAVAERHVAPVDLPRTPLPVTLSNSQRRPARRRAPRLPRTMAAASGCSLPRSSVAASAAASSRRSLSSAPRSYELRLALGERAGLVDDERVDLAHDLDGLGVPEQHAHRGALARRDHDRHRRRQAERARASDDEHRDRVDERVRHARLGADEAHTTNVIERDAR